MSKTEIRLKIQDVNIRREENSCYLRIRSDPKLTFKTHMLDISAKVTKRLNLLKRLASTKWGSGKHTLRQLYIGYIRAVLDYSAPLQITASKHNQKKLDCKQNEALRFLSGTLKTTPSNACKVDANIEPLNLQREQNEALTLERFKRMEPDNPCKKMTLQPKKRNRI